MKLTTDSITQKIYTVSELNANIKALLEEQFPFIWICGEISNFRRPVSGHFYFTLRDDSSQMNAVMFRGQQKQLKFEPEDGMSVIGMGRISVYEPRGTYQIILEYLEPSGVGALQIAFEKLKTRLAQEGYFDESHKKQIPFLPQKIAIITSPTGAVVHDILKIINRRFPNVAIDIIPVKVQGEGAEEEIVSGLNLANARGDANVVIVARGGGSLEDLQAFNSERVATAIFNSQIPVVSAIGHETDFTIADFVADLRAPTPSAAAELVVPEKITLRRRCIEHSSMLKSNINNYIKTLRYKFDVIVNRIIDPGKSIQDLRLRIDDVTARLYQFIFYHMHIRRERFIFWSDRLNANNPLFQIKNSNKKLEQIFTNLLKSFIRDNQNKQARLREISARLNALSPNAILQRGFSITRTIPDAVVVRDAETVSLNQELEVTVAKGSLFCRVKGKSTNGQKNFRTIDETT